MAGFAEYEVKVTETNGQTGKLFVAASNATQAKAKARDILEEQGVAYRKLSAQGYW